MEYSGFRAIVIRDYKIALIERWKNGRHYFVLPGGRLEPGENAEQCVVREIKEELNIDIIPNAQVYDLIDLRKQGIFLAQWYRGTVSKTDAEEYREDRTGGDYEPVLIDVRDIAKINLVPKVLKTQLLRDLQNGFDTNKTITLKVRVRRRHKPRPVNK